MRAAILTFGAVSLLISLSSSAHPPRCDASVEKARGTFVAFVKANRSCRVDADCGVATASCPLPCGTAVARASVVDVEKVAAELVQGLDRDCQCKYKCGSPRAVACRDHLCVPR
jgi:hypothetical protein